MSDSEPRILAPRSENFGDLLARHRKSARLTQEELAAASGISTRSISDMERGRVRAPQQRTVRALARALALDESAHWEFFRVARAGRTHTAGAAEDLPRQRLPPRLQLPPDLTDFTGRERELHQLMRRVDEDLRTNAAASPVVAVSGTPGVGKTVFAVHVGHRLRDRYPDGRLFLDLHGMDAGRLTTHQALGRLLTALGMPAAELPDAVDERSGLYRSMLAERRMVIVLDDAADDAQVRPLLPSSSGNLVLITSRRLLSGLEAVGRLHLDVLDAADSVHLLARIIGPDRSAREAETTHRLAQLCGNLPLALRIAGNRLASRPRWPVANLVRQLDDEQHRLAVLVAGDLRVRAAFEVSYQQCDPGCATVFRRLALVSGPDVTVAQAAVLAELDRPAAERHLEELVDASLLHPGTVEGRYVLHDLMRVFAAERLAVEETTSRTRAARRRLTEWLLGTGTRAGRLLTPDTPVNPPQPGQDDAVRTATGAMHWLDAEQSHWLAALRAATDTGRHAEVLAFARAMRWYADLRPRGPWREVFTHGVRAAVALGRRRDEAAQLNLLGRALRLGHDARAEADRTHRRALAVAREAGDRTEEAWALLHRGRVEGRPEAALGLLRAAAVLFEEAGRPLEAHIAVSSLGLVLHELGRYAEAAVAHRDALAGFRRGGSLPHRNLAATSLLRLAETREATGDWAAAIATYREAGAIAAGVDAPVVEALAWFGCGRCRHELGDLHGARQHLETALRIFTRVGDRWMQARVLNRNASVLAHTDPERARTDRERALDICRALDTEHARTLATALVTALAAAEGPPR